MILEETTEVKTSPRAVYRFFESMEENYLRWHPDHVSFRWIDGGSLKVGKKAHFEEVIAGKRQDKTVRFTEINPNRYIEFKPTSLLTGLLMPQISFSIAPHANGCEFTQRIKVRTGPIGAWLNRREFEAVRKHMREEGENLKLILENQA